MNLEIFHPAVARWFAKTFPAPTLPQQDAWPAIKQGRNTLIAAPTGSGKTLAAFLAAIDDLVRLGVEGKLDATTQVVYVSPLKALSNDIQRNLQFPLAGIQEELAAMGLPEVNIRTLVRTGDTPAAERTAMIKRPPHIVVTTPESLYILLTSEGGRRMLQTARTLIVDEIHAVVGDKRGSHLALSIERLEQLISQPKPEPVTEPAATGLWDFENSTPDTRHPDFAQPTPETQHPRLVRIGLSATQRPIEEVARFLVGTANIDADGTPDCAIVDSGHARQLDLAIELPESPLQAVMSGEVWDEVYDRLAQLIRQHKTTLIFVNTRRLAERVARHLGERIGDENIAAHHGSLAREQRLAAEQRLKAGELSALVATASLELGIDIGDVNLVCQLGSTRSIASFLQRVGRSNHTVAGFPKGRVFPLSRDELVECAAIIDSVRRGELDRLALPEQPLDILAQQIVAASAPEEWGEDELFAMVRRAYPYRNLERERFDSVIRMLAEGFSTKRGRRSAYLHHDAVNKRIRGRRGARLAAITSGGAIPDTADYAVVLEPSELVIGSVNEDFAIESLQGDIFQLGNTSWRVLRVEQGKVRVEDAHGQPPSIPFWLGEAPARTHELSVSVSRLREEVTDRVDVQSPKSKVQSQDSNGGADLEAGRNNGDITAASNDGAQSLTAAINLEPAINYLIDDVGISRTAAEQIVEYLAGAKIVLGVMPSQDNLVLERFFDDSGSMQLVLHSPFGSRLNRAWGLALRKRFCRKFNFELQAAATEDAIVLSLGPTHSFPLDEVFHYLNSKTVRQLLCQALLDAPMWNIRWRWNVTRSLAVLRRRGGKKIPAQLQRMDAEDLLTAIFPDQLACQENLGGGEREIPTHPLVDQTVKDCLEEAMDIDGLEQLLTAIERNEKNLFARDVIEASPLAQEILNARPYAYLDDAPLEERRTRAVYQRRWLDPQTASDMGKLDQGAIDRVRDEAWPRVENADELHDALVELGYITSEEGTEWQNFLAELQKDRRAAVLQLDTGTAGVPPAMSAQREQLDHSIKPNDAATAGGMSAVPGTGRNACPTLWIAAERLPQFEVVFSSLKLEPQIKAPDSFIKQWSFEEALVELLRGRLEGLGPVTVQSLADSSGLKTNELETGLLRLEAEGFVIRGKFSPGATETEWCARRLLARIHSYTLNRLRQEIEPVATSDFIRFLLAWQKVAPDHQMEGPESLRAIIEQLEGFEAPAASWEGELLPSRLAEYDPAWLDALCLSGELVWARLTPPATPSASSRISAAENGVERARGAAPVRNTPIALLRRKNFALWNSVFPQPSLTELEFSTTTKAVQDYLTTRGASFFTDVVEGTKLLRAQVEESLAELVANGLVVSDSFAGLRALLTPASRKTQAAAKRKHRQPLYEMTSAGRWSILQRESDKPAADKPRFAEQFAPETVEEIARILLKRYGVVFKRLLEREGISLPWRLLLRMYHRLEARGEIRGGRFVAGISGEQFALPEAVGMLRAIRRAGTGTMDFGFRSPGHLQESSLAVGLPPSDVAQESLISISAADPLNLVGIITPGGRITAYTSNRILYRNGEPIAVLEGGEPRFLIELSRALEWKAKAALMRKATPPPLRTYLRRPA
ncbi:MAG: ATP-dependent helicase Lhr and Lhr-like helicase [Pyrinomonadaceae bacterium]|jgi:ATP-dependent Lhr-like helicase|nr:ATP-dependent helicase Lhr and Lhr-like helicase [Pyrinomonadaceae bacterium]